MKASWDDIQAAFVDGRITMQQLIEILIDNYGMDKAMSIVQENLFPK